MNPRATAIIDRAAERLVQSALSRCDVRFDGKRPWDIRVRDPRFYRRVAANAPLELGETYVDGLWDCDAIDELFFRLFVSSVGGRYEHGLRHWLRTAWAYLRNPQSERRAGRVAEAHYDIDTDLYARMLDRRMLYTCAYFTRPNESLEEAQENKLRLVCDKLDLRPGQTLLDIGCGFGGLALYAAEHYGVTVLGVTNSTEHHRVASERAAGLPNVQFARMDYRELASLGVNFDKISSIEMVEAVGPRNYGRYMDLLYGCLNEGGRLLMQTFISNVSLQVCNEWFDRHIFPNGVSPSFAQLGAATEKNFGAPRDVHDIGPHYAPTLLAWDRNVARHWPELSARYGERFRRTWHFYLRSLAGMFRAEDSRLCQLVFAKGMTGEVRVAPVARGAAPVDSRPRIARVA